MELAKTFLAIGIAIIFTVFIGYLVNTLYEAPEYQYQEESPYAHCNEKYSNCYSLEGKEAWECREANKKCTEEVRKTTPQHKHQRNTFYILTIIGIITIIVGISLTSLEGIGSGLIGGGILTTLWSLMYTYSYWLGFNKYVKLIVLAIVLFILIYLGYKKIENRKDHKSPKRKR